MPFRHCTRARLAFGLAISLHAITNVGPLAAQLRVREASLGIRPEGMVERTIEIRSAMRFGYVLATRAGFALVVDSVMGPRYSQVDTMWHDGGRRPYITFSPDGKRFAYLATRSDGKFVVNVDGIEGAPFDSVGCCLSGDVLFSPDSRHVAYIVKRAGKAIVIRDGVSGRAYDAVTQLFYSANSRQLIYTARRNGREYVVIDGNEVAEGEQILSPVYSDSTGRLAYTSKKDNTWAVVVDGVAGNPFRRIEVSPFFSRNGRRFVYAARDSLSYVVVDGVQSRGYEHILLGILGLSENGAHVAFLVEDRGKQFWVGRHVAHSAMRRDRWFVVVDGKESPAYDEVVVFASDLTSNESFSVLARRGREDLRVTIPWR